MEEKNGGKRLAAKPHSGKKKTALIVGGLVTALVLGGYLGLCAYAGSDGGRLAPNTRVGGVEVGGLSMTEAVAALDTSLQSRLEKITVDFTCQDTLYQVPGTEFSYHAEELVNSLSPATVPFPARGVKFLSGLLNRNGSPVTLTLSDTPAEVERAAREQGDADAQTTWTVEDTAIVFTKGRTGRTVDVESLLPALVERAEQLLNDDEPAEYAPVEAAITVAPPVEPDFAAIQQEIYTKVADAYLDKESLEIVSSVTGKDLDISVARAALEKAAEDSVCRVELLITEPAVSTEQLHENLFRDVLGESTTRITGTADRKVNVRVSADFVNDTIIFPGEEFSFNKVCSPYTVENGYGKATAYVNGLSKDTVAGGICQTSSTLYWTSLKANLETVERYAHRYEPSYVKGGLDATVYGDYGEENSLDFRFRNNTDYPVKITCTVDEKNYIHVAILGTNTTGIHGEPYSNNRVITKPFQTVYQAKDTVPQGTTEKDPERTGYNGVTIETYQKLVDAEGNTVSETLLYKTKYYHRDEVIYFNPADLDLWGIDPYTGLKVEPTATPEESVAPAESVSPEESTPTAVPSAPVHTPAPSHSSAPAVSATPAPTETPLPVLTPVPTPEELEEEEAPLPPPEQATPTPVPTAMIPGSLLHGDA